MIQEKSVAEKEMMMSSRKHNEATQRRGLVDKKKQLPKTDP